MQLETPGLLYYLSCTTYEITLQILLSTLLDPHDLGLKSQFTRVGSQETINTIAWKRTETINNGDNQKQAGKIEDIITEQITGNGRWRLMDLSAVPWEKHQAYIYLSQITVKLQRLCQVQYVSFVQMPYLFS